MSRVPAHGNAADNGRVSIARGCAGGQGLSIATRYKTVRRVNTYTQEAHTDVNGYGPIAAGAA
jgi:hypothetical protein